MQQIKQELDAIQNFNLLPRSSLEQLGKKLKLRMSLPELLYCARQYTSPNNQNAITVSALRFLDALACPAHPTLAKIAVGEFWSGHACIADTFQNAVAAVKAHGKDPQKPYTLQDFAALASRGAYASATRAQRALYGDALVLLDAPQGALADMSAYARCVCDCTAESPVHSLLRLCTGAILELVRLPEHMQDPIALTECRAVWLLALPQDALPALLEMAQAQGLSAVLMGVVTDNGTLEIRKDKQVLLSQSMAYLRSIHFVRSYKLQADHVELYKSIQMRAVHAYAQAVAAGSDPTQITLEAQLLECEQNEVAQSAAELLCLLLGLYCFTDAAKVSVQIEPKFDSPQTQHSLQATVPENGSLQGQSKIYLLAPQTDADGMPNMPKLCELIAYLHTARAEGKIKTLRAICDTTPQEVLAAEDCGIIYNPHFAQTLAQNFPCAFLAESDFELAGVLVAVTTLPKQPKSTDCLDDIH